MKPFALFLIALSLSVSAFAKQPNVIVIMADDLGYGDLGFTGSKEILTPNLDRLAKEGVECTYGYVTHPYCGPSRAAFLTGRYQQRFGFEANPPYARLNKYSGMPESEILISQRLKKEGYKTGIVGKWHIGAHAIHHPNNRGFDYFFGFLGGGHDFYRVDSRNPVGEGYLEPMMENGKPVDVEGYLTDQLTNIAISFMERNQSEPFFLFVSYNAPHTPLQAPKETVEKYAGLPSWERQTYAAMVDNMDENIGRIVQSTEDLGIAKDTLIFFLSDNGGPRHWDKSEPAFTSNAPFRGHKGATYDGGVHVPFIAYWPGTLPAGTQFDKPVVSIDISRTAIDLAGADAEGMEGVNLVPFLSGETTESPHEAIYFRRRNNAAWGVVTDDHYKWLKNDWDQPNELYNLKADPAEQNDLIALEPERAATLEKKWKAWNKDNIPFTFSSFERYHKQMDDFYRTMKPE
ncbi:MAG: sulfatase-like hydrolase/transferase [Verrucomicrobiota bacterium]